MSRDALRNWLGFSYFRLLCQARTPYLSEEAQLSPSDMPWEAEAKTADLYRLYGMKLQAKDLLKLFSDFSKAQADRIEAAEDKTLYLYELRLNSEGRYIPGSLRMDYYVWSLSQLLAGHEDINFQDKASLEAELDQELCQGNPVFTAPLVLALNQSLAKLSGLENFLEEATYFVLDPDEEEDLTGREKIREQKISDIRLVAQDVERNDPITHYLLPDEESVRPNLLDLEDSETWRQMFRPEIYALSSWPRESGLSLAHLWISLKMQQAYDAGTYPQGAFLSFQAPLGSGRDLLIEDHLAYLLYIRALELSRLSKPADAFTMRRFQTPPHDFAGNFYVPYQMLGRQVLTLSSSAADSLRDLSDRLNRTSAGRDLSYYVGSWDDLRKLVEGLLADLDRKKKGTERRLSFREAKTAFNHAVAAALAKREKIRDVYVLTEAQTELHIGLSLMKQEAEDLTGLVESELGQMEDLKHEKDLAKEDFQGRREDLESFKADMKGFWKFVYLLFKIGPYKHQADSLESKVDEADVAFRAAQEKEDKQEKKLADLRVQQELLDKRIFLQEEKIKSKEPKVDVNDWTMGPNYADHDFYQNINTAEVQASTAWMDQEFLALREAVFKASLDLNRAFLDHSTEIRSNLERLSLLLQGQYEEADVRRSLGILLNTLRLQVPILCVPLDFLRELEAHTPQGQMGSLIYLDPQSDLASDLLGPLWRAGKSFFLSDHLAPPDRSFPPNPIEESLLKLFNLDASYVDPFVGADRFLMEAYSPLVKWGDKAMAFPLRFLDRWSEPMFSLDNRIHWHDYLLGLPLEAESKADDFIEKSDWLDTGGLADEGSLFVSAQADILSDKLLLYLDKHNKLPSCLILVPFIRVYHGLLHYIEQNWFSEDSSFMEKPGETALRKWVKDYIRPLPNHAGPLSDAPRASDEVILMLGCDQAADSSCLDIFSERPEMLHQVFRLAYRKLLIMGDAGLWTLHAPMDKVYTLLTDREEPQGLNKKTLLLFAHDEALAEGKLYPETDRYLIADEDQAKVRIRKMHPDLIRKEFPAFLNTPPSDLSGVYEHLDVMERLSLKTSSLLTDEAWIRNFYDLLMAMAPEDMPLPDFKSLDDSYLLVDFHRTGRTWKLGEVHFMDLEDKAEADETQPTEIMSEDKETSDVQ
jgi:hypothetical protein